MVVDYRREQQASAAGDADGERVRYFPRQILTPADLSAGQEYELEQLRRHNRLVHGWGVVGGCAVRPGPAEWTVRLEPGLALSPQGDEIAIEQPLLLDLSRQTPNGNLASPLGGSGERWYASVRTARQPGDVVYIAVAYAEFPTRPVRIMTGGCGCDDSACEYSRIREGFVVRALDRLPPTALAAPPGRPFVCLPTGGRPYAPPPADPWVVLAQITLNDPQIQAREIDNVTYRRYAAGFCDWSFRCGQFAAPSRAPRVFGAGLE